MVKKRLEHARKGQYSKSDARKEGKLAVAGFVAGLFLAVLFAGLSFPSLPAIVNIVIQSTLIGMSLFLSWTSACLHVATRQLSTLL